MQLDKIREEKLKQYSFKNIAPLKDMVDNLPKFRVDSVKFADVVEIDGEFDNKMIYQVAKKLMPWRKGPFRIGQTFIDSEWQSFIKYNLLQKHIDLTDKLVADVGCNNGYYMFRMLTQNPKMVVGFDPMAIFKIQFDFINHFVRSDRIIYELL